jgi:NADPH-dependent 2,4-dienoyl-CoA reductase/sulfur reductase-like enzyme
VAAVAAGRAEVTIIEPTAVPLLAALGPEMGEVFAAAHRAHGVDLRMGTSVAQIRGSGGRVDAVVTAGGASIPADWVIVGIGAIPNIDLAVRAGLPVSGGVVVDASLRTENPQVFAVGDVANAYNPLIGHRIRVEHWANARNAAPFAARAMLGQDVSYDRMPYFYSDQYDLAMEYTGYVEPDGYDSVVTRGDVEGQKFVAFWLREGRVQAAMHVNAWDSMKAMRALAKDRVLVDSARLADSTVPLSDQT